MQLSIWTDMYSTLPPEEALERLLGTSFRHFEFGCTHFGMCIEDGDLAARAKGLREMAARHGASFLQMHAPIFNLAEDEEAEKKIEWSDEALHFASMLGVKWVVMHPGTKAGWSEDPEMEKWLRECNLKAFRRWVKTAEKVGVGIAIENMNDPATGPGRRFGSTVAELLWLLSELSSDKVGICWDTGHGQLQYAAAQKRALQYLSDRVVALHIADNYGERDDHLYPLRGSIEWSDLLPLLKNLNAPFNFEVPGEQKAAPIEVREHIVEYGYQLARYLLDRSES